MISCWTPHSERPPRDEYVLTEAHLAQLSHLYVPSPAKMDRYLLMHTTGDELLDWRVAIDHYRDCRQVIVQGSDHGFAEFGEFGAAVIDHRHVHRAKHAVGDRAGTGNLEKMTSLEIFHVVHPP